MDSASGALHSAYKPSFLPVQHSTTAVEVILNQMKEKLKMGHSKWVTNSITDESIPLCEAEPLSRKVASSLVRRGLTEGSVVLYLTSDVTQIYAVLMGIWRAGGIAHSSYPEDTEDTILARINLTKTSWIFCDPSSYSKCKSATAQVDWQIEIIVFGNSADTTSLDQFYLDDGTACPKIAPNSKPDDAILILCTSGTTGGSKGVVHTNKTVLNYIWGIKQTKWTERPRMILSKCTHMSGLMFPFVNGYHGLWTVMMHQITTQNIFDCVQKYQPSFAFGFPGYLRLLADDPDSRKYNLNCLEYITTGGVVIPQAFYDAMYTLPNVKSVTNSYGLTECGLIASTIDFDDENDLSPIAQHPKLTVGKLHQGSTLKIIDLITGQPLGPNENGEIVVQTNVMAKEYWNCPKQTSETFQNGWLRTGDLGYYDNQEFLFIVDRIKETFKFNGNHISPSELEDVILKHPDVMEATVFGVPDPNGNGHVVPRALVVLKTESCVSAAEVENFTNERIAEYKKLRGGVYAVQSIPKGKSGKADRITASKLKV